jgi:CheY-like chemotaxis protein
MTTKETSKQTQKGNRILIVDDCNANQAVVQQCLERSGYTVEIAESGHRALKALRRKRFDLILMDLVMPVMDGYEATRRIRNAQCAMRMKKHENLDLKANIRGSDHACACSAKKDQLQKDSCLQKDFKCRRAGSVLNVNSEFRNPHSAFESVPIIGMSGHDPESVMEECWRVGMNDCIGKPLQCASLVSIVRKWITGQSDIPQNKTTEDELCKRHSDTVENQPPIDIEKTITEFQGKTDLLMEVLETFKARVKAQMINIKQHISINNYDPIFSEAHAIKGGAGNLGAFQLSQAAAELEEAAGEESSAKANAAMDDLEKEFHRLYQYLEQSEMGKAVEK